MNAERARATFTPEQMVDSSRDGGFKVIPNYARIDHVLGTLLYQLRDRAFPFDQPNAITPQNPIHLPRNGEITNGHENFNPKAAAQFWFAVCYYMRGTIDSNYATTQMSALYEKHPTIFDPSVAMHMEPTDLQLLLDTHKLSIHSDQVARHWIANAERLVELYEGDPRLIFKDLKDYDTLKSRVQNKGRNGFIGFQEKMTSILYGRRAGRLRRHTTPYRLSCTSHVHIPRDDHL